MVLQETKGREAGGAGTGEDGCSGDPGEGLGEGQAFLAPSPPESLPGLVGQAGYHHLTHRETEAGE